MVDSVKLIGGPYLPPVCRIGDKLDCEVAGETFVVGGMSSGKIQWPRRKKSGSHALIVCGDLITALRIESTKAICHHWGVTCPTVGRWKRGLGIEGLTEGSRRLFREWYPIKITAEVAAFALKNSHTPEAIEKNRVALKARTLTPEHKAKIGDSRRGKKTGIVTQGRAWTPEEESLLGTDTDKAVASKIDRTKKAVTHRRTLLKIESFRKPLAPEVVALLGTDTDQAIAKKIGTTKSNIGHARRLRGIPAFAAKGDKK